MERFNSFSSDQIILTKRQVSMIMASMLLFCLFVFIVGFFLGKRTIIDDFSSKVTKEALHDQIDFLLTTQSLQSSQEDGQATEVEPEENNNNDAIVIADKIESIAPVIVSQEIVKTTADKRENISQNSSEEKIVTTEQQIIKKSQYAQLIGFGTKKAAQSFVARLKKHNVPVILKTVMSKTASGKQRVWYQAITPTYETSQELQDQLTKIKRLEHIRDKDMKIVYTK